MQKKIVWNWELVEDKENVMTYRSKVLGGWIIYILTQDSKSKTLSTTSVFLADRDHEWVVIPPYVEKPKEDAENKASDFASPR